MSSFARMLMLLLAVCSFATNSEAVSADSCMQRWLRLAGSKKTVQDEQRLAFLSLDEVNYRTVKGRNLLPFVLSGGAVMSTRLRKCFKKSSGVCREQAPCTVRGVCMLSTRTSKYMCKCPKGLRGRYCEKDIDECRLGKTGCHAKAVCVNVHGSHKCRCKKGYQGNGRSCTEIDECASSPCQNGGKCSDLENKFSCSCPGGFSGPTCKEDFNECASNPCQHDGQCIDQRNRFVCVCPVRYDGERCQHLWLQRNFFANMERRLGSKLDAQGRKLDAQGRKLDVQGRKQDAQGHKQDAQARKLEQFRKSMNFLHGACRPSRDFCEGKIDGGGWSLVWKHSYLQVSRSDLAKAKTYSSFSKPCTNLNDGWCNVPNKQLPGAKEQMIVAYHKCIIVYAYKSPLNPNLGKTELGARLMTGWSKVVDKCKQSNGVRPDISRHEGKPIIFGIAFDKVSPGDVNANCDTVYSNYGECRWHDCNLPKSISARVQSTQMTVAIFVR